MGNRVTLLEVHTQETHSVLNSAGSVGIVLFSPDGKTLVTASRENGIEVWDVKTARKRHTFELAKQVGYPFRALILVSPDSKTLVSVAPGKGMSGGEEANLWDLRTGELLGPVGGRPNVGCVAFSPNSSILAAGCEYSEVSIRLLDARTGKDLTGLKGHTGPVKAVFFLPDGRTLISGSTDGTIRWWDISAL
jgi:WD40 repeat protein